MLLLFFAMMNVVDNALQLIYRGLTILPRQVRSGEFDFTLSRPVSPFFWSTFCIFDFFDLTTVPLSIGFLWYAVHLLPYSPSLSAWLLTICCLVIGMLLALLLNILIATLAFWTPEIENGVWLYRDLSYISRFPMEIFPRALQWSMTFILPFFMIVAFPAKALMGRLSLDLVIASVVFTLLLGLFVRHLWKTGLSRYTSASS
jgi:ABC-2 type transport system permease protein